MPTITDYLKYANLQMAAEALFDFNATLPGIILTPGAPAGNDKLTVANLTDGNLYSKKGPGSFIAMEASLARVLPITTKI